ncbi:hypothetical protein [Ideonella sp. B508-1]|nr:hypothetical protein [Ideonella sp. B508-1]
MAPTAALSGTGSERQNSMLRSCQSRRAMPPDWMYATNQPTQAITAA